MEAVLPTGYQRGKSTERLQYHSLGEGNLRLVARNVRRLSDAKWRGYDRITGLSLRQSSQYAPAAVFIGTKGLTLVASERVLTACF